MSSGDSVSGSMLLPAEYNLGSCESLLHFVQILLAVTVLCLFAQVFLQLYSSSILALSHITSIIIRRNMDDYIHA